VEVQPWRRRVRRGSARDTRQVGQIGKVEMRKIKNEAVIWSTVVRSRQRLGSGGIDETIILCCCRRKEG
jgi:hypothetical protein